MSANGHLGVDAVHDALLRECGTDRSVRSIESQASRCHVSLRVQQVCPECGVVGVRLNRQSGLCPMCTEIMRLNEEMAFNEILQRKAEEADNAPVQLTLGLVIEPMADDSDGETGDGDANGD